MTFIGIAGPSCAGKSTLARHVEEAYAFTRVGVDSFYKNEDEVPVMGQWRNWELPECVRLDDLLLTLEQLKSGRDVEIPKYSKRENRQVGVQTLQHSDLMIVEWLYILHDERIRQLFDVSIFIDLDIDEQRKRRAIMYPFRGEDYFNQLVVPAYREFGMPTRDYADHIIDGTQRKEDVMEEFIAMLEQKGVIRRNGTVHPTSSR